MESVLTTTWWCFFACAVRVTSCEDRSAGGCRERSIRMSRSAPALAAAADGERPETWLGFDFIPRPSCARRVAVRF